MMNKVDEETITTLPSRGGLFLWYCSVGVSSGLILNEAIASCLSSKTNVHVIVLSDSIS